MKDNGFKLSYHSKTYILPKVLTLAKQSAKYTVRKGLRFVIIFYLYFSHILTGWNIKRICCSPLTPSLRRQYAFST